jgi:hypothetical protein
VLLVDEDFCCNKFRVGTTYSLEEFFNLASVRVSVIRIFVKHIETLGHNFRASFKAHAPLAFVMKVLKFRFFGKCRPFAKFAFPIVMLGNPR